MPDTDFAHQLLASVQADNSTKAQAWEAYHNATSMDDFTQKMQSLKIPDSVKAQLWEGANMRFNGAASAPGIQKPAILRDPQAVIGQNVYQAADGKTPDMFGKVNPAEQTHEQQQTQANLREDQAGAVAQPFIGFAKAAGETLRPVDHVIAKIAGDKTPDMDLSSRNTGQTLGKVGENILEFMTGDEALKSLGVAERLGLMQKVAKIAEESPYIGKAIEIGLNSIRNGVTGGVQDFAHGASATDALKTGATTAVFSAPFNALGEVMGSMGKQAEAAGKTTDVAGVESRAGSKVLDVPEPTTNQTNLQAGVRNTAAAAAKDAGVEAANPESVRSVLSDTGENVMQKAKGLFNSVDEATGGKFQPVQNALNDNKMALRAATSDEEVGKLAAERVKLEAQQEAVFKQAQVKGVSQATVDNARTLYKQASALEDVNKAVELSTSGTRPEVASAFGNAKFNPETLDAGQLSNRLNKLYNSGRLQEAVGSGRAKEMLALSDLMKENPDAVKNYTTFLAKAALHPVGAGKALAFNGAKDVWGMVLNSPRATALAKTALKGGIAADKVVPALINAVQLDQQQR